MSKHEEEIINLLESMPFEQARHEIAIGKFGQIGSPNHDVASLWQSNKEASLREKRDSEMLSINREALRITIAPKETKWYAKPLGTVLLGIIGSLLAAVIWYFIVRH